MVAKPRTNGEMMEYEMAMTARLANFGYRVPHPSPVSVTYRSNLSLGDLSRRRPIIVSVAKLQMFKRLLAAIPVRVQS